MRTVSIVSVRLTRLPLFEKLQSPKGRKPEEPRADAVASASKAALKPGTFQTRVSCNPFSAKSHDPLSLIRVYAGTRRRTSRGCPMGRPKQKRLMLAFWAFAVYKRKSFMNGSLTKRIFSRAD
jgi:hypothetical protein